MSSLNERKWLGYHHQTSHSGSFQVAAVDWFSHRPCPRERWAGCVARQ
jgi:hypothetical protein